MKNIWSLVFCACCQLLLVGCHDKLELPREELERVVVVYMMGENSLSTYAQHDLSEIRRSMSQIPDKCKMAVFFDNSRSDQMPQVLVFDNKGSEKTLFTYRNDPVSTDSATLQGVLNMVIQKCPARNYGLVMWSHGSGWLPARGKRTIGIDNGRNSTIQNTGFEMEVTTLANVLRHTHKVWDYVMFDACFMQSVEVCYELRDVTHWCIASPAEIPANGAPYDQLIETLFLPTEEAWKIAEQYHEYYSLRSGVVISAVDVSQMDVLADATAQVIRKMQPYPSTDDIQQYLYVDDMPVDASGEKPNLPHFYDIGSAMRHWLDDTYYAQWKAALEAAVPHYYLSPTWRTAYNDSPYAITDPEHACGLSLFIPTEGNRLNESFGKTAWAKRVNFNETL